MRTILAVLGVWFLSACASTSTSASPSPRERAEAIVGALSTGDPAAYEAAARENFSEDFYTNSSPQRRADFARRLHDDFGAMRIVGMAESGAEVEVALAVERGMDATLVFSFEEGPQARISTYSVRVGGPPGEQEGGVRLPPPAVNAEMSQEAMRAALDAWLAPVLEHDDFSGVIAISREGRPFVTQAYGEADRARHIPASAAIAYNIASIGKKFTQTAIARLIQDNRLSLQSTIGELLPDYPNPEARSATIEQLVGHQGGIADFFGPAFDARPKSEFASNHDYYAFVSSMPHQFTPGARTEYCNGCYIVLGEIVERVSGMTFEEFVRLNVFAPAGMASAGYFRMDDPGANIARSYTRPDGPGSPYADARDFHGTAGSAAGGVYATAGDLMAFDNALRDGRLVDAERTAWVLGGADRLGARNTASIAVAGGAAGVNAIVLSDGRWGVYVLANVDAPVPGLIGAAIAARLVQ